MQLKRGSLLISATIISISSSSLAMPVSTAAFLDKKLEEAKIARERSQQEINELKTSGGYNISGGINSSGYNNLEGDYEPAAGGPSLAVVPNIAPQNDNNAETDNQPATTQPIPGESIPVTSNSN